MLWNRGYLRILDQWSISNWYVTAMFRNWRHCLLCKCLNIRYTQFDVVYLLANFSTLFRQERSVGDMRMHAQQKVPVHGVRIPSLGLRSRPVKDLKHALIDYTNSQISTELSRINCHPRNCPFGRHSFFFLCSTRHCDFRVFCFLFLRDVFFFCQLVPFSPLARVTTCCYAVWMCAPVAVIST